MIWLLLAALAFITGGVAGALKPVFLVVGGVMAWIGLWPRFAHKAFQRRHFRRAAFWYRLLLVTTIRPSVRARLYASLAACHFARGRFETAELLQRKAAGRFGDESLQATCANNRARALVDRGQGQQALAQVKTALALRPNCPAFLHTQALALRAIGKVHDGLRVLHHPSLHSVRLDDAEHGLYQETIAEFWQQLGDLAYAKHCMTRWYDS